MTTFTMLLADVGEAEPYVAQLKERGFGEDEVGVLNTAAGGEAPETAQQIVERLAGWDVPPDIAEARAAALAEGGALLVVRVTDDTREIAKAILEGRDELANAANNPGEAGGDGEHLAADVTRLASSQ